MQIVCDVQIMVDQVTTLITFIHNGICTALFQHSVQTVIYTTILQLSGEAQSDSISNMTLYVLSRL